PRMPTRLTRGSCSACSSALSSGGEEVDPLAPLAFHPSRLGQPVQGANPAGEVGQRLQMRKVTVVAAQHNRAAKRIDVPEAVSALSSGGGSCFPCWRCSL